MEAEEDLTTQEIEMVMIDMTEGKETTGMKEMIDMKEKVEDLTEEVTEMIEATVVEEVEIEAEIEALTDSIEITIEADFDLPVAF